MNVVGKVSSFISRVNSVATPFHLFGGAVDIIVVKQQDGTFRSTPWYVRFGKFQGVLKGAKEEVRIEVNGVEANFHMYLDSSGEASFVREVDPDKDDKANEGFKYSENLDVKREDNCADYNNVDDLKGIDVNNGEVEVPDERVTLDMDRLERVDSERIFYEFQNEHYFSEGSVEFSEYGSSRYDLHSVENVSESQNSNSEVVLVSVDGHILTAPLSSSERNDENVQVVLKCAKEDDSAMTSTPSERGWRLWPILFGWVKTLEHTNSSSSNEEVFVDSESLSPSQPLEPTFTPRAATESFRKPTTDQIASLNLKEGQNMVNFVFCTRVLGSQKVEAHIHLWKWNTQIVISDVDGTITKSDVLGQFMPLVGKDWTHSGIAHLFSAIKENGYQLLFLSARAIVQAYLTKNFLVNLKQDGKSLPNGPVVISPDGLFLSLYREVIRRAPHEFKIACLEDIKALFPPDYNPFYAGFGNRDTDELSYRKIGIPKGKIFIINPKGEVAINHRIDVKSYTSLQTLVHDMFPPTSLVEQEDYNSWNYWKMPLHDDDDL